VSLPIALEPISRRKFLHLAAGVAAAAAVRTGPAEFEGGRMPKATLNIDFFDMVWLWAETGRGLYLTDQIKGLLDKAKAAGFDRVNYRVSIGGVVSHPSKVMRPFQADYRLTGNAMAEVLKRIDPLAETAKAAREQGLECFAWVTWFDDYFPGLEDPFFAANPGFLMRSRDGKLAYRGVPCYGHPQAREYRLRQAQELCEYDIAGLFFATHNCHTVDCVVAGDPPKDAADVFGFNPPVVEEYKRRFGADPREGFDKQRLYDVQGHFLTELIREVKPICERAGKKLWMTACLDLNVLGNASPRVHFYHDVGTWAREKLADGLTVPIGSPSNVPALEGFHDKTGEEFPIGAWFNVWPSDGGTTKPIEEMHTLVDSVRGSTLESLAFHEAVTFEASLEDIWHLAGRLKAR